MLSGRFTQCIFSELFWSHFYELMEGPVYAEKCKEAGLDHMTPEKDVREKINKIIFDELTYGKITEESTKYFSEVIDWLKDKGCDAVVLGCTEIPLIVADGVSSMPTLDSTRLLARAALREATK